MLSTHFYGTLSRSARRFCRAEQRDRPWMGLQGILRRSANFGLRVEWVREGGVSGFARPKAGHFPPLRGPIHEHGTDVGGLKTSDICRLRDAHEQARSVP